MFERLAKRLRPEADAEARRLYQAIVNQARRPEFYQELSVADTVEGRFDMIALHAFLVQETLADNQEHDVLARRLMEVFVQDMDRNLREMGAGDTSIGKKVRARAEAAFGRFAAYREALSADNPAGLEQALLRNVYAGRDPGAQTVARLAAYVRTALARLEQNRSTIGAGLTTFPEPSEGSESHG